MSNTQFLTSPVPYEEAHTAEKPEKVKITIVTAPNNAMHKIELNLYESKRGVEGLFHCKDHYDVAAKDFACDASDHFNYFPTNSRSSVTPLVE